jgi:hypothetical protein
MQGMCEAISLPIWHLPQMWLIPQEPWNLIPPPAEFRAGGRHAYCGVLPDALKGSFVTFAGITSVPCNLWNDASHFGFGRPEPCHHPRMLTLCDDGV